MDKVITVKYNPINNSIHVNTDMNIQEAIGILELAKAMLTKTWIDKSGLRMLS